MAMTAMQRNRMVSKEAMREQLSAQCHYQHLLDALEGMRELADKPIDQDAKDQLSMLSVIADKHWKIVERYLPPTAITQAQQATAGSAQSALQRSVMALVQRSDK